LLQHGCVAAELLYLPAARLHFVVKNRLDISFNAARTAGSGVGPCGKKFIEVTEIR